MNTLIAILLLNAFLVNWSSELVGQSTEKYLTGQGHNFTIGKYHFGTIYRYTRA